MAVNKRILYVGGLADEVTEAVLQAAFIPFGELAEVTMPMDHTTQRHRGFGFVRFEEVEDAEAAMDNMHCSELYGRVLTVNPARALTGKLGSSRAVWDDPEVWEARLKEDGLETEAAVAEGDEVPFDTLTPGQKGASAAPAAAGSASAVPAPPTTG